MKFVGELEDEVVEDSWVVEASSLSRFSFWKNTWIYYRKTLETNYFNNGRKYG